MGYHSDQALDLKPDSYICLFSCYENQVVSSDIRKLKIKKKGPNNKEECINLDNNSIVLFSLNTNSNYLHKIILDTKSSNKWLGITFRLSKTFIHFINEIPYFHQSENILKMANKMEEKQYYSCRSKENMNKEYEYPNIDYTISIGDTIGPVELVEPIGPIG
jgi:hypothetical protein